MQAERQKLINTFNPPAELEHPNLREQKQVERSSRYLWLKVAMLWGCTPQEAMRQSKLDALLTLEIKRLEKAKKHS